MRLAFSGESRYPDYDNGYRLYLNRDRNGSPVSKRQYKRIVREYCRVLADRLVENGIIDFPGRFGSVAAIELLRKPQYRGKKFVGYGKIDWESGHFDGTLKAFGIGFLPNRKRSENLRCFGFVANRALFKRMKSKFLSDSCNWIAMTFTDEMI